MKIWKWIKIIVLIILPVCLLIFTTASNVYIYNQSTLKVETIKFPSPNGNIVSGDLYYPKNPFSVPSPVVIYLHGLSWSKDSDARFPLDLARKGIAVITLDQEGHGQTTGGLLGRDTLGPFFWKNVIGAIDYIYLRNDIFNTSAIGVFGHSLGGWATLMASVTDPRITAAISLAGPSNLTAFPENSGFETQFRLIGIPFEEDILHNPDLRWNHSAVQYLNGSYSGIIPKNLLLLYGTADTLVPLQHGLDMYKTINDSSRCTLEILNGSDHGLMNVDFYYTNVRIIQFFQEKLLGIEPESRSKIEGGLIFLNVYINHLLSLFLILYP
jgi:dipeptidyl aminopeptidase/acylaminoacyl peptidase